MNKADNIAIAEVGNDKALPSQEKQYYCSYSTSFQFVIFILLMFFIHAPLFFIEFGRLNDYTAILTTNGSLLGYPEAPHLLNLGRPLGAVLVSIQAIYLNSVESLAVGRFVSFALSIITAYLIFKHYIKKKLLDPLWALLAVFLLFTLPSIQLVTSWVVNSPPGPFTVLCATISYILFDKVTPLNSNLSDFIHALKNESTKSKLGIIRSFSNDNKSNIFFLFLSFIVLSAACYVYPANAMFFLIFPLSNILFSPYKDWKKTRLIVLRDIVYLTAVVTIYFLSVKIIHIVSVEIYNETNTLYEFSIGLFSVSIVERVAYTTRVLLQTLDGFQLILLSNIGLPLSATGEPSVITPKVLFIALFIIGCLSQLVRYFRKSQREEIGKNSLWIFVQMAVALFFLILLTIAPLTVPKLSALYPPALRNTIPISAIWVLIAFWSILSISRLLIKDKQAWILPIALAVIVGASTTKNLTSSSLNAHMELSYIRQMLSSRDLSKINRVILLGLELEWSQAYTRISKPSTTLTGDGLQAEFYLLGANNSMQPMIGIALQEMGYKEGGNISVENHMQRHWEIDQDPTEYPKYIHISDELWDKSNRAFDNESTLIINMNHARLQKYKPKPPPPYENFVIHLPASSFTPDMTSGGKAISGGDYSPTYKSGAAFDDDEDKTAWATRQLGKEIMGNAYVGYDFGSGVKRSIRRMAIKQFGAMMASVIVQSSDDGETWSGVTMFDMDNRSTDKYSYDLPPSDSARFWRIVANSDVSVHATGNWLVYEIEMMELRKTE